MSPTLPTIGFCLLFLLSSLLPTHSWTLSDVSFAPCPSKEHLPVQFISGSMTMISHSTLHFLIRLHTTITVPTAIVLDNGTTSTDGQPALHQAEVYSAKSMVINAETMPFMADTDVLLEQFGDMQRIGVSSSSSSSRSIIRRYGDGHMYDGSMREIACFLNNYTLSNDASADTSSVTLAPPPSSTSSSSYVVTNLQWKNCRSTDPIQLTHMNLLITLDTVVSITMQFNTAIALQSALLWDNGTFTPVDGQSMTDDSIFALDEWFAIPWRFPLVAGTADIPLVGSVDAVGVPSAHRDGVAHFYDSNLNEIGCFISSYDITAPSATAQLAATPLLDKPSPSQLRKVDRVRD